MKKLFTLVTFLIIGIGIKAQSSTIKMGPVGIPFGFVSVCYEQAVSENSSFQFTINPYNKVKDYDGVAYGASVEYRLYITKKEVLKGFYLMPRAGITFGSLSEIETNIKRDASSINLTVNLGYQWIWSSRILMDVGFGLKYSIGIGNDTAKEFDRVSPDVLFSIGYAF